MPKNEFIGKNSLDNIKFLLEEYKVIKVLIFAGKISFYNSGANELLKKFSKNITYNIFYKTKKYPDLSELYLANQKINDFKPDIILAIGGGSVLDLAKIANTLCFIDNIKFLSCILLFN